MAKSYVVGSDRLEKLNQEIATRLDSKNEGVADADAKSSWGWGSKGDSSTKQDKNKEAGLASFFSSFFGGKEKSKTGEQTAKQGAVRFQESPDGSFSEQRDEALNNVQSLPAFISQGEVTSAVASTSPGKSTGNNQRNTIETSIPTIESWAQTPEGSIHGFIYGSTTFDDGAYIITTPVEGGAQGGYVITTSSGSQYRLALDQSQ